MRSAPTLALALALLAAPALAHETKRDKDVAALVHFEPDDDPAAKKPVQVWFEATRRGGSSVNASNCACTLRVYRGAYKAGAKPVLAPTLANGAAGEAKGKLAATLTFPSAAAYTVVLEGRPRAGTAFRPFRVSWTVRAGGADGDGHGGH